MFHRADAFATYCAELLASAGPVRIRRMFGGHGLYVDDLFIAISTGEVLFLKVDEQTRGQFEEQGCAPFAYVAKGKPVQLGYWSAPAQAMDSPALMHPWAQLAPQAALRARTPKQPRRVPGRSR